MIDHRIKGEELIGKKCRPTGTIRNGAGECVSGDTICTIVNVVKGQGIVIMTEKCPCCGQQAYIRRVHRNDLTLIE